MPTRLLLLSLLFFSSLFAFEYPIDFVYIWVDGEDPEWQSIKESYSSTWKKKENISDALSKCRFSDHDELKYSLRSIWKYARFYHHIYIVTMNQRPSWLKDHPDITLVDHKEIFSDLSHLPTFNSQAIESHLYQIPHLQEHFLYFNDDFFIGQPVFPTDFFTADGKVRVFYEKGLSPSGPPNGTESSYRLAWRNTNALLDKHFSPMVRYRLCHAPYALRKSHMLLSALTFSEAFQLTSSHRFRCAEDYNITNGLLQYHWFYLQQTAVGTLSNKMIDLHVQNDSNLDKTEKSFEELRAIPCATFCIEDNLKGDNPLTEGLIRDFLEKMFPEPAPWEKE